MKPLFLATVSLLSLLCTACASELAPYGRGGIGTRANPAEPSTGGQLSGAFGITNADQHSKPAEKSGTTSDNHSNEASKTPDGGASATASASAKPPAGAPTAPEGADAPSADPDKAAKDKAAADGSLNGTTKDGAKGPATDLKPTDGSDPSIGRPPPTRSRKLT